MQKPILNYDAFFLKNTHFVLMALVFRKVKLRTTDRFKCIISQLMRETESLAKKIFDELSTVTLGEINLILYSFHLGIAIYWLFVFSSVQTGSRPYQEVNFLDFKLFRNLVSSPLVSLFFSF